MNNLSAAPYQPKEIWINDLLPNIDLTGGITTAQLQTAIDSIGSDIAPGSAGNPGKRLRLPGNCKVAKPTGPIVCNHKYLSIWGSGETQSLFINNDTGGQAFFTVSNALTDFVPDFKDFGIIGASTAGHGIDLSGMTGVVNNGSIRDLFIKSGGKALYIPAAALNTVINNITGSSNNDHTIHVNEGLGTSLDYCNVLLCGPNKAAYRTIGNDVLNNCVASATIDYFHIAGQDPTYNPPFTGWISNGVSGTPGTRLVVTAGSVEIGGTISGNGGSGIVNSYNQAGGYYVMSVSQATGTSAAPVAMSCTSAFNNDFAGAGMQYASVILNNPGIAGFANATATASAILLMAGHTICDIIGGSLSRNAATNYHSIVRALRQSPNNAPIRIGFGSVSLTGGGVPLSTNSSYLYADTNAAIEDMSNVLATYGITSFYQGGNAITAQTFQSSFNGSSTSPNSKKWNDITPRVVRPGIVIQSTPAAPLQPVGANQNVDITGIEHAIISPAAAASISTFTFTNTIGTANTDAGRNGLFTIETGNANLTLKHTQAGTAGTFFLAGHADMVLPANSVVKFQYSIGGGNLIQDCAGLRTVEYVPLSSAFAAFPAANASSVVPYQQYLASDMGTSGAYWYSDGTQWNPVNGQVNLASYGIDFIVPPNGTITAATGALLLGTALDQIYPNGYMYFPAGAWTGSAAGWYWFTMTSTTAGFVYLSTYVPGTIPVVPASPTVVTAGIGAYTQTTGAYIVGQSYQVPAGAMGINGKLRYQMLGSSNNTAGSKYIGAKLGATQLNPVHTTTFLGMPYVTSIGNRGVANSQWYMADASGGAAQNMGMATENTNNSLTASVIYFLGVATDWVHCGYFDLELLR